MSKIIRSICGAEPMREGEIPDHFHVGYAGITRIEVEEQNLGTYGIMWFVVFKGDEEAHRMNALHVATVSYQQP